MFSIFLCASESIGTVINAPGDLTSLQRHQNQRIRIRRISESESGGSENQNQANHLMSDEESPLIIRSCCPHPEVLHVEINGYLMHAAFAAVTVCVCVCVCEYNLCVCVCVCVTHSRPKPAATVQLISYVLESLRSLSPLTLLYNCPSVCRVFLFRVCDALMYTCHSH